MLINTLRSLDMEIINYNQKFEIDVVNLWNEALPIDTITVSKFRNQVLFDDNFDSELSFIAIDENKIIGYILATKRKFPYLERGLEPERGFINVMFVQDSYRKKGIGSSLLKKAEDELYARGARRITLGAYSPNYFFPGIDEENYSSSKTFFEDKGYLRGAVNFSMKRDLHGFHLTKEMIEKYDRIKKEGFEIKPFDFSYTLKLLDFARVEFGGGWKRNLLISMRSSLAEDNVLIVVNPKDEVVGFAMRMIDGNPMRFGPIGISESVRNYGIGGVLFDFMQADMAKRSVFHLYFVTTDIPGRRFYERHGLSVFRTFYDYDKQMEVK